ncbi:MAG: DNA repair protein RecO [Lachnospiraceae bacterium]|nr:DNA repair protein RecO [Lachnospiraceae bacterium]
MNNNLTENLLTVTGMVLKQEPSGEFDRRIVILTKEKGKISVFAKGARRQNSILSAATNPFAFGRFTLFVGRSAYSLREVFIDNYFENMRSDIRMAFYGMYFLEIADYYSRENAEDADLLRLLFQGVRVLENPIHSLKFVKAVFEIKAIQINGELPPVDESRFSPSVVKAVKFITESPVNKVFSFKLSEESENELIRLATEISDYTFDRKFTSLELID